MGFYEELIAGLKESIERDFEGKISRLGSESRDAHVYAFPDL